MLLAEVPDQEMLATPNTKEWGGGSPLPRGLCGPACSHSHVGAQSEGTPHPAKQPHLWMMRWNCIEQSLFFYNFQSVLPSAALTMVA